MFFSPSNPYFRKLSFRHRKSNTTNIFVDAVTLAQNSRLWWDRRHVSRREFFREFIGYEREEINDPWR